MGKLLDIILEIDSRTNDETRAAFLIDDPWLHHSVGRAVRNEFGLWNPESENYKFFVAAFGLSHADDMWQIIHERYKCYLAGLPFDPKPHLQSIKDHWTEYDPTLAEKVFVYGNED